MISRIEAFRYRCLRHVGQEIGNFHLLAGPNASGKSTFLDVVHLLRDLLRDGLASAVGSRSPNLQNLVWMEEGSSFEIAVELL